MQSEKFPPLFAEAQAWIGLRKLLGRLSGAWMHYPMALSVADASE